MGIEIALKEMRQLRIFFKVEIQDTFKFALTELFQDIGLARLARPTQQKWFASR